MCLLNWCKDSLISNNELIEKHLHNYSSIRNMNKNSSIIDWLPCAIMQGLANPDTFDSSDPWLTWSLGEDARNYHFIVQIMGRSWVPRLIEYTWGRKSLGEIASAVHWLIDDCYPLK